MCEGESVVITKDERYAGSMQEWRFTGFDSAWGGRAAGAMCDMVARPVGGGMGLEIVEEPQVVRWDDAITRVQEFESWERHIVAIDQGLVVPNSEGMRPVERKLSSAFSAI